MDMTPRSPVTITPRSTTVIHDVQPDPHFQRVAAFEHFTPPHDVHVVLADPHARPRYFIGANHEEFHFVRDCPVPFFIQTRASMRELLLRPLANSIVWGIGDIITIELSHSLGLPLYTPLYAIAPGVQVVSFLPVGYYMAEPIPTNVALITAGPAGEVVVCNRVTPGSYVAYQTSTTGVVVNEVVVVPPVEQTPALNTAVASTMAPPTVVSTPPPSAPDPAAIAVSSKIGKVVYDADKLPVGVIVLSTDGTQEFIPLLAQNDAK